MPTPSLSAPAAPRLRAPRAFARIGWGMSVKTWTLAVEVPAVFACMRELGPGLLAEDHPWVSGRRPDGTRTWRSNVVYASPSRLGPDAPSDDDVVDAVGRFLAKMASRTVPVPALPQGPKRRMPHAIGYIHGAVQANGAFVVLDDLDDLVRHCTSPAFRRDLRRFVRRERREVTLVLRTRRVDPLAYAYAMGCVRTHLPWFSNGNGPTREPVLWGNTSPYPAVNLITGAWLRDLRDLRRGRRARLRPAPAPGAFRGAYVGTRVRPLWHERLFAWVISMDVRSRGFRGQLFFSDRRRIEPHRLEEYRAAGGYGRWSGCGKVPFPFPGGERRRACAS